MSTDSSFAHLRARLEAGDPEAAQQVFDTYAHRLIGLARAKLEGTIRKKEDPEDVVQSALASFFLRQATRPFALLTEQHLWAVLTCITLRKCGHRVEHYLAQKRDVNLEVSPPVSSPDDSAASYLALARDPSPSEAAVLSDTVGELLRGLDEREQRIVRMFLEGYTKQEISDKIKRSEYMVGKVIDRVRDRWSRLCQ
jgi:RNA polymerase sigma-70 factor (ECF subfamily)